MRERERRVLHEIMKYGWRIENRKGGAWTLWRWLVDRGLEKETSKRSWYLAYRELERKGYIEKHWGERGWVWYITEKALTEVRR